MRAGNAYHRVKFYAKVITRDEYNASVDSWPEVTIATRGEIRYEGGDRILSSEERFFSKAMELIVRYRSSIVETMRVQIDEGTDRYAISYIEELGRRDSLKLSLEKINQ